MDDTHCGACLSGDHRSRRLAHDARAEEPTNSTSPAATIPYSEKRARISTIARDVSRRWKAVHVPASAVPPTRTTTIGLTAHSGKECDTQNTSQFWEVSAVFWKIPQGNTVPCFFRHFLLYWQTWQSVSKLLIGAHPHVIEPYEVYKGKLIVYSLRNFVFDNMYDEVVRRGNILTLTIQKNQLLSWKLVPMRIGDWGEPSLLHLS